MAITDQSVIQETLDKFDSLPNSACVREPVVAALFGCSRATVWRWVNEGRLPSPIKLGPRYTAWNVGSLRAKLRGIA